ncbi:hypothetical protein AB0C59_25015 [Streptomyces sp. NPDC048664]|uniref:hypothetical protein n=1 Tax=Streptomyces sp. NPDC048664 TaxID=3154505 RepID=UPI00343415BB
MSAHAAPEENPSVQPEPQETHEPHELQEPPKASRRGRRAAVLGAASLGLVLAAGVVCTAVVVHGADHDPGAPVWETPAAAKESGDPKAGGKGLAGMLVPYGTDGLTRGPDIEQFGSDAVLSGRQATDLAKASLEDLPRTQRLRLEQQVDKRRIKGLALRSYLSGETEGVAGLDRNAFTMNITLLRLESAAEVRKESDSRSAFLGSLDFFRKGPEIQGYKNAHCFLSPKAESRKFDTMFCTAYQGDVLVTASASAARPLDTKGAAELLRTQLSHMVDQGEAV